MLTRTGTFVFHRPRQGSLRHTTGLKHLNHFSRHIQHQFYQCPIYCWLAQAFLHKKDSSQTVTTCYFIYLEYRDNTGASRYLSQQFLSLNEALIWLENQAGQFTMPDICPRATTDRPIQGATTSMEVTDNTIDIERDYSASGFQELAPAS